MEIMNKDQMGSRLLSSQYKPLLFMCFTCFAFSGFLFNLPFLVVDDPLAQNVGNYFLLYEDDYHLRYYIKYSFYASFPVGGLVLSFISDKIGRRLIIKYLLMWNIVFLVFAGISLCPHFIIITSFLLGILTFTGISASFLLVIESVENQSRAFCISILLFSTFSSLFTVTILNILRFNWRTITLGNALLSGLALFVLKSVPESNDWLYDTNEVEDSEKVNPNTDGQVKEENLTEKTEDYIKRISKLDLLKLVTLYINLWTTCFVLLKVSEGVFWDIYWERGVVGCAGGLFSFALGSFLNSKSILDYWVIVLTISRGGVGVLYAVTDAGFKASLFVVIAGLLIYELVAMILVIKMKTRPKEIHFAIGGANLVAFVVGIGLYVCVLNGLEESLFYFIVGTLVVSSVLPAWLIKVTLDSSFYSLLSQDSQQVYNLE